MREGPHNILAMNDNSIITVLMIRNLKCQDMMSRFNWTFDTF